MRQNDRMRSLLTALQSFRSRPPAERARLVRLLVDQVRRDGVRSALQRVREGGVSAVPPHDYARWYLRHTPGPLELDRMRTEAQRFRYQPQITIVTPVYNTDPEWLDACAESVVAQVYPRWQWSIGNDGSTKPGTLAALDRTAARDSRIVLSHAPANGGISAATNLALSRADGEYVALMDSDDALLPHALFRMVEQLNRHETPADVLYSDEDKLDLDGSRCEAYFKPDWSPEHFLSNMYVCHLLMARRDLVQAVGGFRTAFDFSQDYDLMLRLMERARRIDHVSDILYHWRKVPQSGATAGDAKPPAHIAGRRALQDYLDRNQMPGEVVDAGVPGFYRPRFRVDQDPLVSAIAASPADAAGLQRAAARAGARIERVAEPERAAGSFVLFGSEGVRGVDDEWLLALLEVMQLPGVAAATPMILGEDGRIHAAGLVLGGTRVAGAPLVGHFPAGGGYFGSTLVLRNVSAAGIMGLLVRRDAFAQVGGFDGALDGGDARAIDLCLRLRRAGHRIVHTPWARLIDRWPPVGDLLQPGDRARLQAVWQNGLDSDPYYNRHLSAASLDYHLNV
jgi:GT2 family glycosyltransferase